MARRLLGVAERIRTILEQHRSLTVTALADLLLDVEERMLLDRALAFLSGRDEILVELATHSIHLREHVSQSILSALGQSGPLSIDQLAQRVCIAPAVCCDVLGWLERDGRVQIGDGDIVALGRTRF